MGQVGLRCVFCKDVAKAQLTKQAICFPSKRDTIFESVRNYQRTHMAVCPCFPEEMKAKYKRLTQMSHKGSASDRSQKYTKAYYAEAASELGIVNTPSGLAFGASPNESGVPSTQMQALVQAAENPATSTAFWKAYSSKKDKAAGMRKFEHLASDGTRRVILQARKEPTPFVHPEDFPAGEFLTFLYSCSTASFFFTPHSWISLRITLQFLILSSFSSIKSVRQIMRIKAIQCLVFVANIVPVPEKRRLVRRRHVSRLI